MEVRKKIMETLGKAHKPLKSIELAALSGITKSEADNSIKLLQKEGKIYSPKRCYYKIKLK